MASSKSKINSIRVTSQSEPLPPMPSENFVNVTEPDTKISLAPSIVTEVKSKQDLTRLTEGVLPATAILSVNSNVDVVNQHGKKIASLESVIDKLVRKIIPAFSIADERTIAPLVNFLKEKQLEDVFITSSKPKFVKKAREAYPISRGIVEITNKGKLNEKMLMDTRGMANSHLAKIVILPQEIATKDAIEYLQRKLITVWVKESARDATAVNMHNIITTGPNGMIVSSAERTAEAMKLYTNQMTLVRKSIMVGHRGIPALAPENTLEGAILAYEKGAEVIENDIYLSADGHIVIMHDATIDRTTTGKGNVESMTLAQLKQYKANTQFPDEYPNAEIPTLREYFEEFKGKDVDHFVEIKSEKREIVNKLIELIREYQVEDQVSVISFKANQLKLLGKKMPRMSAGFLTSGIANEANVNPSLRAALNLIQPLSTTFNPSYSGLGKNFMEAAKHRGVTLWPWTYRNIDHFKQYFLLGTNGLTTDNNYWASDWAAEVKPKNDHYKIKAGETVELKASIKMYDRRVKEITPELIFISGEDIVSVQGHKVTGNKKGTAHALLRYTQQMDEGNYYDLYTEPVTIKVQGQSHTVKHANI